MDVKVNKFFERPDARIYLLDGFVSQTECQALKDRAEPHLVRAAVTGDSPGEKVMSSARKAKASMVSPRMEDPNDVLAGLRRRVFDFANEHTGDHWDLPGQEPFNVIKYNVSGDEYR